MKQIVYVEDLSEKSGRDLVRNIQEMSGVTLVISTPQVLGKRGCIVESELRFQSIHSQLGTLGYKTYNPQGKLKNVSQTRIN